MLHKEYLGLESTQGLRRNPEVFLRYLGQDRGDDPQKSPGLRRGSNNARHGFCGKTLGSPVFSTEPGTDWGIQPSLGYRKTIRGKTPEATHKMAG